MIARVWRGWTTAGNADEYIAHLRTNVLPELRRIEGHQGAYVLRREINGRVEIAVLTLWETMEAVRKFAGEQPENAVVEPEARAVLSEFDTTVRHYEVVGERG